MRKTEGENGPMGPSPARDTLQPPRHARGGVLAAWHVGVVVMLAACLPYLQTLGHALVWDDPALVELVTRAEAEGGLARVSAVEFRMDPHEPTGYYRPVVLLSLWFDGAVGRGSAAAYHATNVILHVVCALLVAGLAGELLRSRSAAMASGVLFAVHPAHVEPVAFVAGRTDLWAGCFVLASTFAWVRGRGATGARRALLLAVSGLALGAALLAKEVAIALPVVLVAWDVLMPTRPERGRWPWRLGPWLAAWLSGAAVAAAARSASGLALVPERAAAPASALLADPTLLPHVLVKAIGLLAVPWPLDAFWERHELAWTPASLSCAALGVAVLVLAVWRGDRKIAAAGAVWTLAFIAPVAGFAPLGAAPFAERFLYLPSAGFCLALGSLAATDGSSPRFRSLAVAAIAAVTLLFAGAAAVRASAWRDEVTLFESTVRTDPSSATMWDNLGQAYATADRRADAERAYQTALRLDPRRANAWNGLGVAWGQDGKLDEAARALETAIRLDPSAPQARFNLAMLCLFRGDRGCAEAQQRELQRIAPDAADRIRRAMAASR